MERHEMLTSRERKRKGYMLNVQLPLTSFHAQVASTRDDASVKCLGITALPSVSVSSFALVPVTLCNVLFKRVLLSSGDID